MSPVRAFRSIGNSLGLAWWARVETREPGVTYWFGPFLRKKSLSCRLPVFIEDLTLEGSQAIDHSFIRTRKAEPLTS